MSIVISKYENNVDKAWYDSSNVIYSECIDNADDYKDLFITFKDSRTYHYKGVTVQDYLLFREDVSQGKALNKYITKKIGGKPVYEFERLENKDLTLLNEEKDKLLLEKENLLVENNKSNDNEEEKKE